MTDTEVKDQLVLNLEYWRKWKNLHYIDWEQNTREAIQQNLRVVAYRTDISAKVSVVWQERHSKRLQELKDLTRSQKVNTDLIPEILRIQQLQRSKLLDLQQNLKALGSEVEELKKHILTLRPLTKNDIDKLVATLLSQPKEIERQTEALTIELTKEVHNLKKIILEFEGRLMG
ncbi:putative protein [Badnavirus maculakalanchoes]|uniref:Uncharacterized protein n=1 Tax=Badnavirus maculakalanchoes TaxID=3051985 RepID=Q80QW6_9VIRU|nr:hypothetical protein [Badnavirus maculakalanchoes]AAO21218.1 putative protein [Badnavirus maculakalanchoes]